MYLQRFSKVVSALLLFLFVGVACKSKEPQTPKELSTVLVQLYTTEAIASLEKNFTTYSLAKKKVVSRPMNIVLFTFNTAAVSEENIIKELKASELVKEAQKNNEVQTRN